MEAINKEDYVGVRFGAGCVQSRQNG